MSVIIKNLTENVEIVQTLSTYPNQEDGLSDAELKAKFDEGAKIIKDYLNDELVPAVREIQETMDIGSQYGLDKSLKVEGRAADSKAVGDAIKSLTAEDVGARPDTWVPTAYEVGARPSNWMPTAAQVGARPNTWLPTIAEIGAAPAGYGFGEPLLVEGRSVLATWGETFESFCGKLDALLATMDDYAGKLIIARGGLWDGDFYQNSGNCQAILYRGAGEANASLSTVGAPYDWEMRKVSGVWQPPEWVNPPLVLGVEYRTKKRYQGKPVYTACFSCGNLPASGTTETPWYPPDGSIVHIISHDVTYGNNQGSVNGLGYKAYSHNFNEIRITNEGGSDWSGFTATALIEYWKE